MAININGINGITEVCRTFQSIIEVGWSKTLQLGTIDVTDIKTTYLGTKIAYWFFKITLTEMQEQDRLYKICEYAHG